MIETCKKIWIAMSHHLLPSAFYLLFLCLLPACDRQQEPIKIGLAVNLSGPGGAAGEHIRDGAMQAVEDINGQGGINGRPLLLLIRDDQNTKEGVLQADEALITEGVVAIVGHSHSTNTLAAYPYVTSHNTLLITAYTSTMELSGRDDLFLRTAVDSALYGVKTATLLKNRGFSSVACLIDSSNPVFGDNWTEQTKLHFQGDIRTVRFDPSITDDWLQVTAELLSPVPDAIILLTESSMSAKAAQFIRKQNTSIPLIATLWSQSPELVSIGGQAVESITILTHIPSDNTRQDYQDFSHRLQQNFGKKANARSARAHEMITILADALERTPIISSEALKSALLAGEYESILGHVTFDSYGDVVRPVYEVIVDNGGFRTIGEIR